MSIFPQNLTLLPHHLSASDRSPHSKSNYNLRLNNPILSRIEKCTSMPELHQLHARLFTTGLIHETFAASRLLAFCALSLHGDLNYALALFRRIPNPNLFIYNAMIRAFSRSNHPELSLHFYCDMLRVGCSPDGYTFPFLLKSCAHLYAESEGEQMHAQAVKAGLASESFVCNSLVRFYAELGRVERAHKVFDAMPDEVRNEVSCAAMIAGFVSNGRPKEAVLFFCSMDWRSVGVDQVTLATVLSACARVGDLMLGREIHSFIEEEGVEMSLILCNSLLNMYVKCEEIDVARAILRGMPEKDCISWSVLISALLEQGQLKEGLELLSEMKSCNVKGNQGILLGLISACRHLDAGKAVHDYVKDAGFGSNVTICNALIDMYSRVGQIELGRVVFDAIPVKDTVSWNSMVAGYARYGLMEHARLLFDEMTTKDNFSWSIMILGYTRNDKTKEAIRLFKELLSEGVVKPDNITLVSVLSACSDLAAVEEGKAVLMYIKSNNVHIDNALGTALIDMYAKSGSLEEALELFEGMKECDVLAWTAMISGLAMHGRGEEALSVFRQMQLVGDESVTPNSVTFLSVLSACSHAGLVEEGKRIYCSMSDYGIKPEMAHVGCMVDLLGRAGLLDEAVEFIGSLVYEADASVWGALLSACRIHGDVELGEIAVNKILELEPAHDGALVLMSNIYAEAGKWRESKMIRKRMKKENISKEVGHSWIEIDGGLHKFTAGEILPC